MRKLRPLHLPVAFAFFAFTAHAESIMIGGQVYVPSGPSENLTAVFTSSDGGATVNAYSGLAMVSVAGFGESYASDLNDAFYIFTDAAHNPAIPVNDGYFYQLGVDAAPLGGSGYQPTPPIDDAKFHMVFDIDAGTPVAPPYVPAYRPDHAYSFVVDVASLTSWSGEPGNLHFDVTDGNYSDNTGSFTLTITQLVALEPDQSAAPEPAAAPEPPTPVLLLAGLVGLCLLRLVFRGESLIAAARWRPLR